MASLKKIEGWLRRRLRSHPFLYAFVGGVGVVLFWRGVWHSVDFLALTFLYSRDSVTSIDWAQGVDSAISLALGTFLLLSTGLFISELLSGEVLLGKIKEEEATEQKEEKTVEQEIHHIAQEIKALEDDVEKKK